MDWTIEQPETRGELEGDHPAQDVSANRCKPLNFGVAFTVFRSMVWPSYHKPGTEEVAFHRR
jgi:hypothetical protein